MSLRKAAEMALEFVEWFASNDHSIRPKHKASEIAEALRQALAMEKFSEVNQEIEEALKQPKREWVGLTDEEGAEIWADFYDIDYNRVVTPKEMFKRIETKLKEKNT